MSSFGHIKLVQSLDPIHPVPFQPLRQRVEGGLSFGHSTNTPPSTTTEPETGDGLLVWTAYANVESTTLEALGVSINWPDDTDNEWTTISRSTHTERVTNPEDPDQYVDVEVWDAFTAQNKAKKIASYTL